MALARRVLAQIHSEGRSLLGAERETIVAEIELGEIEFGETGIVELGPEAIANFAT